MTRSDRGEAWLLAAVALVMVALGGYGAGYIWDAEAGKWLLGRAAPCAPGERETAPCVARGEGRIVRYYSTSQERTVRNRTTTTITTYVVVALDGGGEDAHVPVGTALTPVLLPPGSGVMTERFAGKIIGLITPTGRYLETGEHPNDKAYRNRGRVVFLLLYAPIWAFFAWLLVQMLRSLFGRTPLHARSERGA